MNKSNLVISVVLLLTLCTCTGGKGSGTNESQPPITPDQKISFGTPSLDGLIVNQLEFKYDVRLAATNGGIFKYIDESWQLVSRSDWRVSDVVILYDYLYIAAIETNVDFYLAESLDGGETWSIINSDFGGPDRALADKNEKVHRLSFDDSTGILYATGYDVMATSGDFGRTWESQDGLWQGFARGLSALALNIDLQTVWFGGQGAIENLVLREYSMTSYQTKSHSEVTEHLATPSTIKGIVFDPNNSALMYASGEGGIVVSRNSGQTWEGFRLNDESRFYFDLVIDPVNSNVMYTAGWSKYFDEPQLLIVERTIDGGKTWEQFRHPDDQLFGGVYSIAFTRNEGDLVLHLGLYKGGIMQVSF